VGTLSSGLRDPPHLPVLGETVLSLSLEQAGRLIRGSFDSRVLRFYRD